MSDPAQSITDILDQLEELAHEHDRVTLGQAVELLGTRGYGPFLILPVLIELSPLGSVPGVPTFLAALIVLFALQILWGRKHLWLPKFIARLGVAKKQMLGATGKIRPVGRRADRWFHCRLPFFTTGTFKRVAAGCAIGMSFLVPPLEFVPFASTAPMLAVGAFGLAMLVHDGLLMLVGLLLSFASLGVVLYLLIG